MPHQGKRLTLLLVAALAVGVLGVAAWRGWPHLRFWWLFEPLGKNAQGYPEYRHRRTGIVMVRVPGGTFWMGAQKEDPNGRNYDPDAQPWEGPVHEVELSPFLIAKYELNQAVFERVMGSNPSQLKGVDLPVERVTWDDSQEFCRKAELRLPTEAQWEYACRAGTTGPYSGTGRLDDMGWYDKNSGDSPHRVGQKRPNGFGLYDMHGNVWEWCEDIYVPLFYAKPEASRKDPVCTRGAFRCPVLRGGSWGSTDNDRTGRRSAARGGTLPDYRSIFYGFRPAAYPLP